MSESIRPPEGDELHRMSAAVRRRTLRAVRRRTDGVRYFAGGFLSAVVIAVVVAIVVAVTQAPPSAGPAGPTPIVTPVPSPSSTSSSAATLDATPELAAGFDGATGWRLPFADPENLVSEKPGVFQLTSDGGSTWTDDPLPAELAAGLVTASTISDGAAIAVGTSGDALLVATQDTGDAPEPHPWRTTRITPEFPRSWLATTAAGGTIQVQVARPSAASVVIVAQIELDTASPTPLPSYAAATVVSEDGGRTFRQVGARRSALAFNGMVFRSPEVGVAVVRGTGPGSSLEATTDGGAHWTALPSPLSGNIEYGAPVADGGRIVVPAQPSGKGGMTTSITLLTTSDGRSLRVLGAPLATPLTAPGVALAVLGDRLWLWPNGGYSSRTTDGGESVSVAEGMLYASSDDGATWSVTPTGMPQHLSLDFSTPTTGTAVAGTCWSLSCFAAANFPRILTTTDGGRTWSPVK